MATIKWQCTQCGGTQITMGLHPSIGGFCGKSNDHKHKWVKIYQEPTKWQCRECGSIQTTTGLRPSVGGFCSRSKDHRHKWNKI